jgi:hypothetical protein
MTVIRLRKNLTLLALIISSAIIATLLFNFYFTYTPPELNRVPYAVDEKILLLFWSNLWGVPARKSEGFLEKGVEHNQCPVACEVTSNRDRIKHAHAFIVHARDPFPLPPTKDIPWILTGLENPVYTPVLQNPSYMSQFHILRSYRLDSDFPTPTFKKPSLNPPVPFRNKTGGIMAAFTNCEAVRTEYLRQLMRYIPVDSYGGCLRNKRGLIDRYGTDFKKMKSDLQRNYKFALTFFNQDCDYFVDDQILHALNAGTVPVVMATDKIYEFLPGNLKNAIINVRDFKNPQELARHLTFLMNNETEYNKHLEWKRKGLGEIGDTVIGKYWTRKFHPWCGVCQTIAEGKWNKQGLKVDVCQPRQYKTWGINPF